MTEPDGDLDRLIDRADLDGLIRMVDARCSARDWDGLARVRIRSRHATLSGRQLWPVATLAEYRLALWAPAEWAAAVVTDDSGRFTIGPLTEVVAQRHSFADLRPHLTDPVPAAFVAHERALRGEAIDAATLDTLPDVLGIPVEVQSWEPPYMLAEYTDDGVTADPPPAPTGAPLVTLPHPDPASVLDDPPVEMAVRQLVETWTSSSNGRAEISCVEGDAPAALAALGLRAARLAEIEAAAALRALAWAGASGGAMGRRRGAALGRFGAWSTVAAIADLGDNWADEPEGVGEAAAALRWYWWHADEPATGWELQLVAEDAGEGCAWAINARDDS